MSEKKLTQKQRDAIGSIYWAMKAFGGGLHTGGNISLRTIRQLVKKGIVESIGYCEQCDDDGFLLDGRNPRECFALTEKGLKIAKAGETND